MTIVRAGVADAQTIHDKLAAEHAEFLIPTPSPGVIAGCLERDWVFHDDGTGIAGMERVVIWISRERFRIGGQERNVFMVQQCWAPSQWHGRVLVRLCKVMINRGFGNAMVTFFIPPRRRMPIIEIAKAKALTDSDRLPDGMYLTTFNRAFDLLTQNGEVDLP